MYSNKGWVQYEGDWYYVQQGGSLHYGTLKDNGKTYHLIPDDGKMWKNNWIGGYPNGNYFLADGSMATGWNLINNQWHYFGDGVAIMVG